MLLVRGGYLWTGDELIPEGAALCAGDRIEAVGNWRELRSAHPDAEVVGGPGMLVLPGLINAHHHGNGITSFMRGVVDEALEPWLAALGAAPSVDPYLDTLWAAIGLLKAGYTTVALFQSTADPEQAGAEARARIRGALDAGVRLAFGLDLVQQHFYVYGPDPEGLPPRRGLSTEAYIALLEELQEEYASDPRVKIFAAPSGPQWVTDSAWEAIGAWTKQRKTPLHTHCLESPYEAEFARRAYGGSVVSHLDRLGALHAHTSLVHGVYLAPEELERMSARGASLITNPGSNLRLRCGVSPVLAALERGVTVALGTDGCTLGDRDDALAEIRLLLHLQRGRGIGTPALTWRQALQAATAAAAAVTSWGEAIGGIKPGGLADFSIFDYASAERPWTHPELDPLHVIVHRGSADHLAAIVVGGRLVWEATRGPVDVDADAVAHRLHHELKGRALPPGGGLSDQVREYYRDWPIPPAPASASQ